MSVKSSAHLFIFGGLVLVCLVGCERERRVVAPEPIEEKVPQKVVLVEEKSWLYEMSADESRLAKLGESGGVWTELLQNRPLEALYAYDAAKGHSVTAKIGCARSALELARTAERLEHLTESLVRRALEVQSTRPGVEKVAGWRAFASGQPIEPFKDTLGEYGQSKPIFLDAATKDRNLPAPATDSYRERWALLDQMRDQPSVFSKTKRTIQRLKRTASSDFVVKVDAHQFEYVDRRTLGVSRIFFARKALKCLADVGPEARLYRIRALKLSGQLEAAKALAMADTPLLTLPDAIQVLSLETSPAAMAQSIYVEGLLIRKQLGEQVELDEKPFKMSSPIGWLRLDQAKSLVTNNKSERAPLKEIDGVVVNRQLIAELTAKGLKDTSAAEVLVSRYVDELRRQTADAYFMRGDYPRAAQIRRRIGGGDAFTVGPKVSMAALAGSALDHWKIVEPRASIRYLKELGEVFPNARRASDLLRDILSYRARQKGGQTAAGQ